MSARRLAVCLLALACGGAGAQTLNTYTEQPAGPNTLAYGLPVPLPIDSLTPIDGFRSYPSVEARLQGLALESDLLSAHDVGRTFNGRIVWAYVVGDADGADVEGRPEAAFFINASTHAREWGTPEVSTGTIERLLDGANDGGLTRYLLDNTRLVIIPVHNVDGVLQTQRYPTQVLIGQDPDVPSWPRDGRMRRKNMRGVDEQLLTFGDHLGGVDLNRNHPPFWAASPGNFSNNPASLVYPGTAPHTEPENQALLAAAQLGPVSRFRLGIDVHSFSRVFFSTNTARTRLNGIQNTLINRMASHHLQLAGAQYANAPNPPNQGIGTAAEYFGHEWLVPSWTLEIEPQQSVTEYGGFDVNHGGFILPASQARRVRESWAETHALAFYLMSGPPHLRRVRVYDTADGALVHESQWHYDGATARRVRAVAVNGSLERGRQYRVELAFNKPMRQRDANGQVTGFPGVSGGSTRPNVALLRGTVRTELDTAAGQWLDDPQRVLRYEDDSFAFEFVAPDELADYQLEVGAFDMAGMQLDADPSTPADWDAGAWSEWENAAGADGDIGGADSGLALRVAAAAPAAVEVLTSDVTVGEGDRFTLRLRRATAGPEAVAIELFPPNGDLAPPTALATWAAGESGERSVAMQAFDDLQAAGDGVQRFDLGETSDGVLRRSFALEARVLDNDGSQGGVLRVRSDAGLREAWRLAAQVGGRRDVVLDGGLEYPLPIRSTVGGLPPLDGELRVHGNAARLRLANGASQGAPLAVPTGAALRLDRVDFLGPTAAPLSDAPLIDNEGTLALSRSSFAGGFVGDAPLLRNRGDAALQRVRFEANTDQFAALIASEGTLLVEASSVADGEVSPALQVDAGTARIVGSTFTRNSSGVTLFSRAAGATGPEFGHTLIQRNVLSTQISPPILENCGEPALSLGFNLEDRTRCGFQALGDQPGTLLDPLPFDAEQDAYLPVGLAVEGGASTVQAGATGCTPVDLRGAPRPQAAGGEGTTPRCDIGAVELGVNPYRGIWQPARSGHGVELHTSGNRLLLVWYTYADDGQPTSYQAVAPLTGAHWEADLLQPRRDPQSGAVSAPRVGRVEIDFSADDDAQLRWRFDAHGVDGSERIRPAFFASGEPRFEVSGVWYPPAESGYGATVTRRGEVTAAVLYYYDAAGNIRWVLGSGNGGDALEIPMSSFTGFCPDCDAAANPVQFEPAGSVLLHFHTPERARLDTQITYPGAAGGTWNRERAALVPLNDPVDNRFTSPPSG